MDLKEIARKSAVSYHSSAIQNMLNTLDSLGPTSQGFRIAARMYEVKADKGLSVTDRTFFEEELMALGRATDPNPLTPELIQGALVRVKAKAAEVCGQKAE